MTTCTRAEDIANMSEWISIITGMVGTLIFGLSLRDCSLLILFFSLLTTTPAAYFSTFGARTGLRQMLHARFTFG